MNRKELIKKYIGFFKSKNHKEIPNVSLVPENDPTVLFTTAGMHPLVPYLLGEKHPLGKKLVNVQRCIRTVDIDEVGDKSHGTFFEMLGNWSLGDYWKEQAIKFSFEFLTKILGLKKKRLAVTIFKGNKEIMVGEDEESIEIWRSLGVPNERIADLGKEDNWWGPAGETGPCGPCTEIFYWTGKGKAPRLYDPKDKNWVEIGNNVFMEYNKTKDNKYEKLKQQNVDFGGGLDRQLAIINNIDDIFKTELYLSIIKTIEKISGKKYGEKEEITRSMRIIADHVKATVFIIGDGVIPSNVEQGYVLRRLIRRVIRHGRKLGMKNFIKAIAEAVFEIYDDYKHLQKEKEKILDELEKEEKKFLETLEKGIKVFEKIIKNKKKLSGKDAFLLYQSYGFPLEIILELAKENRVIVDENEFREEERKHQELSRTESKGRFRSGLANSSMETTKLHTATHLLNEALRKILGNEVKQRGSNITPERLRFDFSFSRKLTDDEIKKVEDLVNEKIKQKLEVIREEMPLKKALESGAQAEFGHKYPKKVYVYTVLDNSEKRKWFSKEICTGPHINNTKKIGKFKIIKEEASSARVRRIKAELLDLDKNNN